MVTYQGSPVGFIVAGALVIASSRLWATLFTRIAEVFYPLLFRRPAQPGERSTMILLFTASTALVGAILLILGLLRLVGVLDG